MIKLKHGPFWKSSAHNLLAVLALPMGEQVATLPQGRFMAAFMTLLGGLSGQYSTVGANTPIANQFNRNIQFSQIATEQAVRANQIQGLLDSQGVEADSLAGQYVGKFDGGMQAMVPLLGYGITDRWGVFFTIPILKIRTQFATAFQASSNLQSVMADWTATDQTGLATNIQSALESGMEHKLTSAGYRYEPNAERTLIGDLQMVSPWVLTHSQDTLQIAIMNQFSFPTGQVAQPDDLYGISAGAGRMGLGTGVGVSYRLHPRFLLSGSVGGALLLPAKLAKRIPTALGDNLSPDIDSNTLVGVTPSMKLGLESRVQLSRSWSARLGYQYQLESQTPLSGDIYPLERYSYLSQATGQELHTLSAGIDFNLIRAFLDGDFLFPTQLGIAAALPIAGRNTLSNLTWLIQTALFF